MSEPLAELETPALVIDLDVLEANLAEMAAMAARAGVGLRPHTKTHKSPEIARLQLAAGATGITCAKLGEAEVMADAGLDDLLIAYPLVGDDKLRRLCQEAIDAGLLEVLWAFTLKLSHGFSRPAGSVITLLAMIASFARAT